MALFQSTATPLVTTMGAIATDGTTVEDFLVDKVLPPLPVQLQAAQIPKILRTNRQIMDIKHAPGTAYKQVRTQIGTASYSCQEAGLEEPVTVTDHQVIQDIEYVVGQSLVKSVLRQREAAVAQSIFSATGETTFAANLVTASVTWATKATAVPLDNVAAAQTNVLKATGIQPDTLLTNWNQYKSLCLTSQILSSVKAIIAYGGGAQAISAANLWLYPDLVAQAMGLKRLRIAKATYNSANEAATESNGFIWPDGYALVYKEAENASQLNEVALGRMFVLDQASAIGSLASGMADTLRGFVLESYRNEAVSADMIRAREFVDPKILNASAGALIKSI